MSYYVSEQFINEIKKGSYESYIESVQNVLNANASRITGKDLAIENIATFKNHAIVMDEECDLYRVSFEDGPQGASITNIEKIDSSKMDSSVLELDLMNQFANDFVNSIDNETIECKNKIREGLSNIFGLKLGEVKGYRTFKKK